MKHLGFGEVFQYSQLRVPTDIPSIQPTEHPTEQPTAGIGDQTQQT